ncbi:hypothetical protein DSO57_1031125 [Entomophthora muscae]|uniref:Uncharacterized protein n=1 Tax=Entomophthora muscae TaxID=34485 RepID=A0ACC2SDD3_9FUNG|nr:hypothetical protein DSO57_1031125 [Entomophthora muscae]
MEPPPTPKPTISTSPTSDATGQNSQFLGVLYLALTGLIDSALPAAGPWAVAGKALSYLVKLGPIIWWSMPVPASTPPSPTRAPQYSWYPDKHLEITDRGREFIGNEFNRLLKDWYRPTEGLAPAEVQVHSGDSHLLIGKVLEGQLPLLGNDNSSKLFPGYAPGHTMGTGEQEPHNYVVEKPAHFDMINLEPYVINLRVMTVVSQ